MEARGVDEVKTVYEIQCWLKNKQYALDLDFEKGRFYVDIYKDHVQNVISSGESASLEGALENALEELRRKDNGAESMRTEKLPSMTTTITIPTYPTQISGAAFAAAMRGIQSTAGSIGPVSPPPPQNVQVTTCPQCGKLPDGLDKIQFWVCPSNHVWSGGIPLIVGSVYHLIAGYFRLDGFDRLGWARWTHVP